MIKKKKFFLIATFLIIAAIAIVICVGYFTEGPVYEYDGTLVESNIVVRDC